VVEQTGPRCFMIFWWAFLGRLKRVFGLLNFRAK